MVGNVGVGQRLRIADQDACDIECDVAVADHHGAPAGEIGRHLAEMRMRVVPTHEVDGRDAARQLLAGDVQRAVGLCAGGVDDGVVAFGEFARLDVLTDPDVAEEPEAGVGRGLLELGADRLDLRMVGSDAGAHQTPRGRQHLEHVHADIAVGLRVGKLQQRCGSKESGGS